MTEERPKRQMRAYPKVPELCLRLRTLAMQRQPHERLPGVTELCTLLGTSSGTLNEVLGLLEAQDVLYRKVGRGIYVSPQLFRTRIGILFSSQALSAPSPSSFWGALLDNFRAIAQERYRDKQEDHLLYLLPHELSEQEHMCLPKDFMQQVEAGRIHGALGVSLGPSEERWFSSHQINYVSFAGYSPHAVELDEQTMIRLALLRLREQGCRAIGLWGVDAVDESKRSPHGHIDYFQALLHELDMPFDPALIQTTPAWAHSLYMAQKGSLLARQAFSDSNQSRPDGIIVLVDSITEGVIPTLPLLGIHIGEQLRIATHGNKGTMLLFDAIPGVSVIEFDPTTIVHTMFDILDRVHDGQEVPQITNIQPYYRQPVWFPQEYSAL